MSPEQREGDASATSDLWSVALIAYQMLTGREGPAFEPPSRSRPGIDPEWDEWFQIVWMKLRTFFKMPSMIDAMPRPKPPVAGVKLP